MGAPIDNSPEAQAVRWAQGLTNQMLALSLERFYQHTGPERRALLEVAARRMRWRNEWEKTATV